MKIIGYVGAEGGPLLIIDAELAYRWGGIDTDDYDRVCALFDENELAEGIEIEIGDVNGLLWELNGPGVAYIIDDGVGLRLVRAWLNEGVDELAAVLKFAEIERRQDSALIGRVVVSSKKLAVIWATENGDAIQSALGLGVDRNNKKTSIDDSSIVIGVKKSFYTASCDIVSNEYGRARRLFLV
ncbi:MULTISPECIES: hypothetical protein [Burkholderia]|uniref:hypothetical protein n=1 Tax=Burkholderia TaxID=32008 RepID=UPI001269CECD|nr:MULTISPECIES: hypothetical protein [Burkholderia]